MKIAEYINMLINNAPKTQSQIAKECGFKNINTISMIKNNKMKIPVSRIEKLAISLNADAGYLLTLFLQETDPALYSLLKKYQLQ